jgi:hypothetical protein
VASDAELAAAVNDGEREVEVMPSGHFDLLRTFGLTVAVEREPVAMTVDLLEVDAAGADPYLAVNMVLAGLWAGQRGRRRLLVAVMGERRFADRATSMAVANGQFAAGGRWLAPRAHPADGRLAVLVDGQRRGPARRRAHLMAQGEHVPHRDIHQFRPLTLEVEGPRWALDADGTAGRGRLPARFSILPGALTLLV